MVRIDKNQNNWQFFKQEEKLMLRETCTRNKFLCSYTKPMADNKERQNFLIVSRRTKLQAKIQRILQIFPNRVDRKQKKTKSSEP